MVDYCESYSTSLNLPFLFCKTKINLSTSQCNCEHKWDIIICIKFMEWGLDDYCCNFEALWMSLCLSHIYRCWCIYLLCLVSQSCLTLQNQDCSPLGSFVHRVDMPFSRGSSQPRDWTQVSRILDIPAELATKEVLPEVCEEASRQTHSTLVSETQKTQSFPENIRGKKYRQEKMHRPEM